MPHSCPSVYFHYIVGWVVNFKPFPLLKCLTSRGCLGTPWQHEAHRASKEWLLDHFKNALYPFSLHFKSIRGRYSWLEMCRRDEPTTRGLWNPLATVRTVIHTNTQTIHGEDVGHRFNPHNYHQHHNCLVSLIPAISPVLSPTASISATWTKRTVLRA